ncbi:MAG: hypothetical protein ACREBC_26580 [Pyrinomonadaceae bacterium]
MDSEGRVTFSSKPPVGAGQVEARSYAGPSKLPKHAQSEPSNRLKRASPRWRRAVGKDGSQREIEGRASGLGKGKGHATRGLAIHRGGGRYLKQSYFDRVKHYEAGVEKAKKALRAVR